MERYLGVIHLITFLGSTVIVFKILLDSHFEKMFKQGKINTIKIAYCITSLIIAYLIASSFTEFFNAILKILEK